MPSKSLTPFAPKLRSFLASPSRCRGRKAIGTLRAGGTHSTVPVTVAALIGTSQYQMAATAPGTPFPSYCSTNFSPDPNNPVRSTPLPVGPRRRFVLGLQLWFSRQRSFLTRLDLHSLALRHSLPPQLSQLRYTRRSRPCSRKLVHLLLRRVFYARCYPN